jgi:hypothetical protein
MNKDLQPIAELQAGIEAIPMLPAVFREILQASYWEHFKAAKDLALYLEPTHPKRIKIESEMNKMLSVLNGR